MKKRIVQSALLLAVIGAVAGSAAVFGGSATSSPDASTAAKLRYRYQHKALSPSSEEAAHLALLLDRVKAKRNVVNAGGAPIGPPPSTVSWDGQDVAADTTGETDAECNAPANPPLNAGRCDDYTLTLNTGGPARRGALKVDVTPGPPEDYDLYIYDKNGEEVGSSGNPNAVPETATVDCPAAALSPYRVRVVYFQTIAPGPPLQPSYHATATYSDKACPDAPPDRVPTYNANALTFAPGSLVSAHFLGVEPQTTMERTNAPGVPGNNAGGIDNNRIFVDWPLSSRSSIGQLSRSLDGGETFRLLIDQLCALRNRANCATGGGGDTDSDVSPKTGTVFFADQEVLVNEASASSTNHGDTFVTQTPAVSSATATDRQWIAATDDSVPAALPAVGNIEGFFTYHVPPTAFIHAIPDSTHVPVVQPIPQLTDTGQTGQPKVDNNPSSLGYHWIYYPYDPFQGGGTSVATARSDMYALPTAWTTTKVTENAVSSFPWIAIDDAGNAYMTWDSAGFVYFSYSPIADSRNNPAVGGTPGTYWSQRARVTAPGVTSSVFPEVIAAGPGRIGVTYMGTTDCLNPAMSICTGDPGQADVNVKWQVYAAVITAANTDTPVVNTGIVQHRPYVHRGNICTSGTFCGLPVVGRPEDDRSLADMIDIGVDSQGRIGVVFQDNNTASFQDLNTEDLSPFVYFAKQITGQTLFTGTSPVNLTVPRDARNDPAGDATFPNTAAGTNIPGFDITRLALAKEGTNLVAHLTLADVSPGARTGAITSYNAGSGTHPALRSQYVVRFNSGTEAYHMSLEVLVDGTLRAFGGKLDSNDGIANPGNPTDSIAAGYHTDAPFTVTHTITGTTNGEITLSAPLSQFGLSTGSVLFSVTAFATAGPLEQVEQLQTGIPQNALYVMRTVDVSPPFDTTLGGTTGVRLVYFTATRNAKPKLKKKVLVKWKTGAEPDTVGFRLYRQVGAKKTRIGKLFLSKGATGGVYSYTDTLPKTVAKACYAVDSVSPTLVNGKPMVTLLGKACMKK